jgi:hypothetical protein
MTAHDLSSTISVQALVLVRALDQTCAISR